MRTLKAPNVSSSIIYLFMVQPDDQTCFFIRIPYHILLLFAKIYLRLGTDMVIPRGRPCSVPYMYYTSRLPCSMMALWMVYINTNLPSNTQPLSLGSHSTNTRFTTIFRWNLGLNIFYVILRCSIFKSQKYKVGIFRNILCPREYLCLIMAE